MSRRFWLVSGRKDAIITERIGLIDWLVKTGSIQLGLLCYYRDAIRCVTSIYYHSFLCTINVCVFGAVLQVCPFVSCLHFSLLCWKSQQRSFWSLATSNHHSSLDFPICLIGFVWSMEHPNFGPRSTEKHQPSFQSDSEKKMSRDVPDLVDLIGSKLDVRSA